jgi:hypothetical protein
MSLVGTSLVSARPCEPLVLRTKRTLPGAPRFAKGIEMPQIPRSGQDFTVPWLNEALAPHLGDARVVGCIARAFESPGHTAGIVMLELEYSSPCGTKPTLVARIATQDPMVLLTEDLSPAASPYWAITPEQVTSRPVSGRASPSTRAVAHARAGRQACAAPARTAAVDSCRWRPARK